jgi:monoamine oxidase
VFDNTDERGQASLLGFIVGRHAREWGLREAAERQAAVLDCLERWFGAPARSPLAYVERDWSEEPWTRGCPIGVAGPEVLSVHGAALRSPVGRIHWAGTETATEWTGFMEGALQSGDRVAAEVLAAG